MKNLIVFFLVTLLTSAAQSQSLTEKELTGTWQVISVVDNGKDAKLANGLMAAYFDILPDHNFQLRIKANGPKGYRDTFKNTSWIYNETEQTLELDNNTFPLKISKKADKTLFELIGTDIILEVVKPS